MEHNTFNDDDIAQAWQKMADEKFSNSILKKEDIMNAIKMESNSNLTVLKTRLKYKLYWTVAITLGLVAALVYFSANPQMVILFGTAVAMYILCIIPIYLKYRKIEESIIDSEDILGAMKENVATVKGVLNAERLWGLATFIPSCIIGILFGRVQDGMTLVECFQSPRVLTLSLVVIAVIAPLMFWTTNKMNQKAYGEDLTQLEENIIRMETLQ